MNSYYLARLEYSQYMDKCATCGAWPTEPCFDMRRKWKVGPVIYKVRPHLGRKDLPCGN